MVQKERWLSWSLNMPEVAHRALSNSIMSVGHPDTKEHWVRYSFMCLQNQGPGKPVVNQVCVIQYMHCRKLPFPSTFKPF